MSYNPRKAAQTIAYFILKSGAQDMSILKAVKLVYLADRACIEARGFPIQDEDRVSMTHGPVNSSTYDYIKSNADLSQCGWADFLYKKNNRSIQLSNDSIKEEDLDELSKNEIKVLEGVWAQFGQMTPWQIRTWTHNPANVPEWEDPNGSTLPISLLSIMHAVNLPNAEEHAASVEDFSKIDYMLKNL
ncbi:MAG: SocA family protein [Proteobacteria bacterium]|nr:SocA family protein [Pseudomonadota bacterium]